MKRGPYGPLSHTLATPSAVQPVCAAVYKAASPARAPAPHDRSPQPLVRTSTHPRAATHIRVLSQCRKAASLIDLPKHTKNSTLTTSGLANRPAVARELSRPAVRPAQVVKPPRAPSTPTTQHLDRPPPFQLNRPISRSICFFSMRLR
ncbi:hypothetical protein BT67DRAFT_241339 [Trichocladium antarcticum]|uniref:Uncharacterized protein n=1 Tax=Trichocladium antarcticum TaxID=1450529 RepID=A0AAN6UEF8_9PEZI|nr:hypothetical protein BT67DRAFT_241339 [Trichocladium antarcticum]